VSGVSLGRSEDEVCPVLWAEDAVTNKSKPKIVARAIVPRSRNIVDRKTVSRNPKRFSMLTSRMKSVPMERVWNNSVMA